MLFKRSQSLMGWAVLAGTAPTLCFLAPAQAQMTEQEFQMGRAREACTKQAQQQLLSVNRVISTNPINGSGGRMIGSEVVLSVTRQGATYTVQCRYDNASRSASIGSPSQPPNRPQQTSKPVPITYASARACVSNVSSKIRGGFSGVEKLTFSSDTTRAYFISNAEESIRGEGQFYQSSGKWHRFSYDCTVNIRNGQVVRANYRL